jgi:dUTP pyrophosphatase
MKKKLVPIYNKGTNDLPKYKTEFSAGCDLQADLGEIHSIGDLKGNKRITYTDNGEKIITVLPFGRVLIPTGIYVAVPIGYEIQARPRSGLAINIGVTLTNSPGTVDSDYRGEVGLIISNTDPDISFEIRHGDRLAQGVLCEVTQAEWLQVYTIEDLGDTERGSGGFGHTGIK